jgi:hypothetical protein
MKRTVIAALIPLVATPLFITAGTSPVAAQDTGTGCVEPVAERRYTQDQLSYRLAVDLTDCDWWDRSHIQLDAALQRISADGDGGGVGSLALCGVMAITPEREDMSDEGRPGVAGAAGSSRATTGGSDDAGMRAGACAIEVTIDHPPLDTAHYKGAITFPWQGGPRTVSFNAICQADTGCIDLPLDPTTALAPAAELYDTIGGDDSAG